MRTIRVNASRDYDVTVGAGLLAESGERIAAAAGAGTAFLVSDTNVAPLYAEKVIASLEHAGFRTAESIIPAGEDSKNLSVWGGLLEQMAAGRLTRGDIVLALGGGVVGDLAGFAAAVYQRGIRFVQLPTTLLSAMDSSVGGKTAVDLPAGKNLIGAFHQPSLVLCDTDTLATLPPRQIRSGTAEIIKTAVLSSQAMFERLEKNVNEARTEETIAECVAYKRDIVAADEYDTGVRASLNLGHTVGHAVELCSSYNLTHGEAVSVGLAVIVRAAAVRGFCRPDTAGRIIALLEAAGLPVTADIPARRLFEAALSDKKRRGDTLSLIVPEEIGRCRIERILAEDLLGWIRDGGIL